MTKELCGIITDSGPCTLKKGHSLPYHRHRVYSSVTWTIETSKGVTIETGSNRVELNYAVSRALENHKDVTVHIRRWDTLNDTELRGPIGEQLPA